MVVEWQRLHVRPDVLDLFLRKDAEIWTEALVSEPGFLGKELWLDEAAQEVILVIRWRSAEEWKGIPAERLAAVEQRFRSEVQDGFELLESRAYRSIPSVPVPGLR
jgi:uncharacterized protein (TIGR03792 family)